MTNEQLEEFLKDCWIISDSEIISRLQRLHLEHKRLEQELIDSQFVYDPLKTYFLGWQIDFNSQIIITLESVQSVNAIKERKPDYDE